MARKPRIHYYGAINHIIARGNNKEHIFLENRDKDKYLKLLQKYRDKYDFQLYSYALMNNHLHLLLEVRDVPLSVIMQGIQLSYTQYFNKKYDRVGHVFQQRYKALLCEKDNYLLTLVRYIHENPVRAGLCPSLDYQWSSHKEYLSTKSELVSTQFVLNFFGNDLSRAVQGYLKFMGNNAENVTPSLNVGSGAPTTRAEATAPSQINISTEELLSFIAGKYDISEEMVLTKSKLPNIVKARRIFLYLAVKNNLITRTQVAQLLGVSASAVTKAFNEMVYNNKNQVDIQNIIREVEKVTK